MYIGKSVKRKDIYDKAIGRAKYTDDLCDKNALIIKILHSSVANGKVISIDTCEAKKVDGVVEIFTCFDIKEKNYFYTAGHPYSLDPKTRDVADRLILTDEPKFYGDDIACVVARDNISANRALKILETSVKYEEKPFVLDELEAMKDNAPQIHEKYKNNILEHTSFKKGDVESKIKEPGLIKVSGIYRTPAVQHCHIENNICFAYGEGDRTVVVTSTQIPHLVRKVLGMATGLPHGKFKVIKPVVGGGFGNKQDIIYEPLCAWVSIKLGGRLVKIDLTREETFVSTRVRHAITFDITSWLTKDGTIVARKMKVISNQGAYASHGHSIVAKGMNAYHQFYPCENEESDAYTVFTNRSVAGAMRGYGMPQASFAYESHAEDMAKAIGMDPLTFRRKNLLPVGFKDEFSGNQMYFDTFNQCFDKGAKLISYEKKFNEFKNDKGNIRRGIGVAAFWYNTGVYPISLETASCRLVLNEDGSLQVEIGETEIGQGADTVCAQMLADSVGVKYEDVHVVSNQDTDVSPFGTGVYASRGTYVMGFSIKKVAAIFKEKILKRAENETKVNMSELDIIDGNIVNKKDNKILMSLSELALIAQYEKLNSEHITAESTHTIKSNAYSFGCSFAEVEVDISLCKVKLINIVNIHDCGKLINPALAEAQVHGGMSMGIGYALSEKMIWDRNNGKLLNGNLLDYKISSFRDHPNLNAIFVENSEPTSPFGTKGIGEPPVCPVAPAIRNAVYNATGVLINELPLDPHNLYVKFKEAGLIKEK